MIENDLPITTKLLRSALKDYPGSDKMVRAELVALFHKVAAERRAEEREMMSKIPGITEDDLLRLYPIDGHGN